MFLFWPLHHNLIALRKCYTYITNINGIIYRPCQITKLFAWVLGATCFKHRINLTSIWKFSAFFGINLIIVLKTKHRYHFQRTACTSILYRNCVETSTFAHKHTYFKAECSPKCALLYAITLMCENFLIMAMCDLPEADMWIFLIMHDF